MTVVLLFDILPMADSLSSRGIICKNTYLCIYYLITVNKKYWKLIISNKHRKEWDHIKETCIYFFFLAGYIFICQTELILNDVQWLTCLYVFFLLLPALLQHSYTCPEKSIFVKCQPLFLTWYMILQTQRTCFSKPV